MAKRKNLSSPKPSAKRARQDQPTAELTGTKSVVEQAEPYLLATAKFPISALTSVWKVGRNRQVDRKHVQSLQRIFKEQNLQREVDDNHLRIMCSREEVDRMKDHLNSTGIVNGSWPDFTDWTAVNGTKVEIMAGQHRVEALKLFLEGLSSQSGGKPLKEEQSWWVCKIYDIGEWIHPSIPSLKETNFLLDQLPARLRIQLRANRQDSTLPDSHGQVWMELVTLATADSTLFQGTNGPIQDEMLQTLGLSGRVAFPIRRLVTLWKNSHWQQIITRWCQTSIGQATFNVSLWEEMARCRIDDVSIFKLI
jgi:hypothetical protein